MNSALDDARFWEQVIRDGERTIVCAPELEPRIRALVEAHGLSAQLLVETSQFCDTTKVFVVDHRAIEASARELLSGPLWFGP